MYLGVWIERVAFRGGEEADACTVKSAQILKCVGIARTK